MTIDCMHGLEVVMYLLYKIKVPHKVFLLRGNHETRAVNGWIDQPTLLLVSVPAPSATNTVENL